MYPFVFPLIQSTQHFLTFPMVNIVLLITLLVVGLLWRLRGSGHSSLILQNTVDHPAAGIVRTSGGLSWPFTALLTPRFF